MGSSCVMYGTAIFCKEGRSGHGVVRSGRSHVSGLLLGELFCFPVHYGHSRIPELSRFRPRRP